MIIPTSCVVFKKSGWGGKWLIQSQLMVVEQRLESAPRALYLNLSRPGAYDLLQSVLVYL